MTQAPLPEPSGSISPRGTTIELALRPDELVYGFGLQLVSFAERGKKKTLRVNADPKVDTGDTHAPVSFYVTTAGVGLLIDTARYFSFYVGDARPKPEVPASTVSSISLDPNYTHTSEIMTPAK